MSRFTILMYHSVSKARSVSERKYACSPQRFLAHMRFLRSRKYNLVGLREISEHVRQGAEMPPNTVAVTIDDGLCDTYENAFPILQAYSIPATVFLVAGLVDGTNTWMEARGLPSREMLKWSQVREMQSKGIVFGSHTMTHRRLPDLSNDDARQEILESR